MSDLNHDNDLDVLRARAFLGYVVAALVLLVVVAALMLIAGSG